MNRLLRSSSIKKLSLLSWLTANGAAIFSVFIANRAILLSWYQLRQAIPELVKRFFQRGIKNDRYIAENLEKPDIGAYQNNIPTSTGNLAADGNQISSKIGGDRGINSPDLADSSSKIMDNATTNLGKAPRPFIKAQQLNIFFNKQVEAFRVVCQEAAVSATKGFAIAAFHELCLSGLEQGLAFIRGEISLQEAIEIILRKSLKIGISGAIAAVFITFICALIPALKGFLLGISPFLLTFAMTMTLKRIHNTINQHCIKAGWITPIELVSMTSKFVRVGIIYSFELFYLLIFNALKFYIQ